MDTLSFNFSPEKNNLLIRERGISFEEIVDLIIDGRVIEIANHPDQRKYPGQKIYFLDIDDYVYAVPFIREKNGAIFLKTIFPTRKATKKLLKEKGHE